MPPATPPVAVKIPVEGLKLNLVEVTLAGRLPVYVVTQTGYIVALVVVSSVMPTFTAFVALPTVIPEGIDHWGADPDEVRM